MCRSVHRPHVPISKLAVSESYDTYISRSFQVTREILAECNNLGQSHAVCFELHVSNTNSTELTACVECSLPLSHRKHGPDRGPCFLPRGVHSPDSRPHSPKLQGLCPSCPKGQCAAFSSSSPPPRSLTSVSSLCRFHTWVFVLVKKWERPGCGSWWTRPSCL